MIDGARAVDVQAHDDINNHTYKTLIIIYIHTYIYGTEKRQLVARRQVEP